jgi:hypothetical protein
MAGATAKACFAVCFLFTVSSLLVNAFPTTSNRDVMVIQQNNAINAISDAVTVSYI